MLTFEFFIVFFTYLITIVLITHLIFGGGEDVIGWPC
uniref:Uncharacterized protein n=1 Tax=Anguilla anguilla TaxID=7936 RepID=A0A0E9TJ11_ANGAN